MPDLTPEQFVARWRNTALNERQTYQSHFIDLCHLVGVPPPDGSGTDARGRRFTFEEGVKKDDGGQGYADAYYQGHFAVEYKAPGKYETLDDAYIQLKRYRENLENPPLLVVTDIAHWEIHTNFTNAANTVYTFAHEDIANVTTDARGRETQNRPLRILRALFNDPNSLHPERTAAAVTAAAAAEFEQIAAAMRKQGGADPRAIAHFLTKVVFCLFAEDVGLLPVTSSGRGLFTEILEETYQTPSQFMEYMGSLFRAMASGGNVLMREVKYFNGKLFDDVTVEELPFEALTVLRRACRLDWSTVEPAIFGTLFERSLDPAKRSQLGAHYTSPDDINLIIEPVLMAPLRRAWDEAQTDADLLHAEYNSASNRREQVAIADKLAAVRDRMLARLRDVKVLDPACGSGNFLYMSLRALLDLEKAVINHPAWNGDGFTRVLPEVHPSQMYGIEINEIAHDLATVVVWIGWIQWKINNGYPNYPEPILANLGENIQHKDAILAFDEDGNPTEPAWPAVDVIVGNPPFLGGYRQRGELGDTYIDAIWQVYAERVPKGADFVTYWFEKARFEVEADRINRVGLLATSSIRDGYNRKVLERINSSGGIFAAWADKDWVLEGASLRVSIIGFDNGSEKIRMLDGQSVEIINSDLTQGLDFGKAERLSSNKDICHRGDEKHGAFDISAEDAAAMLDAENPSGVNNADVVRPYMNARDLVQNSSDRWIIDFNKMPLSEAEQYVLPLAHVRKYVKPTRDKNKRKRRREYWWHHGEIIPNMRKAIEPLSRFIVTPETSKYRVFAWIPGHIIPDHKLHVISRDDDYFFGVLHSKLHEVWAIRLGSRHGDGDDGGRLRYTPTTTFETFPFPWSPGAEDTAHPAYARISAAAAALHAERDAWLNPADGLPASQLKHRTLTNLYNALSKWRDPSGYDGPATKPDADAFAPRLDDLHRELDRAVCDAYGWPVETLDDDEAILRRLLALNLQRAG